MSSVLASSASCSDSQGGKGASKVPAQWTKQATESLISSFEETYVNLKGGNLKGHHWAELAKAITAACPAPVDGHQCKTKMENLKKKFKLEVEAQKHTGCQPSSWPFFDMMAGFMHENPKVFGCPGGLDPGYGPDSGVVNLDSTHNDEPGEDIPVNEGFQNAPMGSTASIPAAPDAQVEDTAESPQTGKVKLEHLPGVSAKRAQKRRKSVHDGAKEIANSISAFAEAYARIEAAKLENQKEQREMEKHRQESSQQLAMFKLEQDKQQAELRQYTQVEMAKLFFTMVQGSKSQSSGDGPSEKQ